MPKIVQTRQSYDLLCLSIKPKNRGFFTKLYKAALGDSNLLFTPNHKGCGFLVKPDAQALDNNTTLKALSEYNIFSEVKDTITAAVQVFEAKEVYYFLSDGTYITVSANGNGGFTASDKLTISDRWGWAYNGLDDNVAPERFSTNSMVLTAYKNALENIIETVDLEKIFLSKDERNWTEFEDRLSSTCFRQFGNISRSEWNTTKISMSKHTG